MTLQSGSLLLFVYFLLVLFRLHSFLDVEFTKADQIIDEVLRNLHGLLRVQQRLLVSMQLGQ